MELNKLRDELAMDACMYPDNNGDPVADQRSYEDFVKGFDAALSALSALTDASGEFDEKAAEATRHSTDRDYWVDGARWQFEQDRARIGHWMKASQANYDHGKQLEARLAESEALVLKRERECRAVEAKVRELEAEVENLTNV